ncbi:MAG: energy-coupling factor transporter transmembrane component T [Clostridia bacterium]
MRFYDFHPVTLLVFFVSVIVFTMSTMNPVLLLLSLSGAFCSVLLINRKNYDIFFYLTILIIISITNPVFSHNGETVLFYLFDQRITLQSFIYGVFTGVLIIAIMYWFKLFSHVFTQDKLTWIIGRTSPKLSLVFCMALRFVPLFKENAKDIYQAQISMGTFKTDTLKGKFTLIQNVLSAFISMSIENAIETADTMRSRGFSGKRKGTYSLFSFSKSDVIVSLFIIICDAFIICFTLLGKAEFIYYPAIVFTPIDAISLIFYTVYALLCFTPVLWDIKEGLKWKYLISKI